MVIGGISMVLVPLVIVGAVTFIKSSQTLEEISKARSAQIAQGLAGMIQINLSRELKIVSALAEDRQIVESVSRGKYSLIDRKLRDLFLKIGTEYEGLAVLDKDGNVRSEGVDKKRIGINLIERDYFQAAKKGKTYIGTPVFSKASGQPIIGVCAPVRSNNGKFIGAALAVVKIDFLINQMTYNKVGKTGYPFMIDARGIVIAHPDKEYVLKIDMHDEEGLEAITKKMLRQETGSEEYIFRGKKKLAGFAPVEMTGWSVGVTQDMDEIMTLAYVNLNFIFIISCTFLGITILAVFFFSRTISSPIQKTLTTLNQAIEQAMEAIVIIGLDHKVQFVNPAMATIVGQSIPALIGSEPLLNNTKQVEAEEIWKTLEQGKIWTGCLTDNKQDGVSFFMDVNITPVRGETGKISCFLAIGRDITRELKMETQMRQGQKLESIGTLAGGIAHDFNNILSAVFGYTELAISSLGDRAKSLHYLKEIITAAERARDLVSQIMTFSRQKDQEKQPLMPQIIIKEVLKLIRASLPATIEIQQTIVSDELVLGDPTQIHQVIMNLCTNAGYAMRDNGGVLNVRLDDIDIDDDFAVLHPGIKPGRHIRLTVSDSGCGIPPEVMDRIFDPFFTSKPPGEGTGLGLSVVHGIVKSLDGSISVYSEEGKGTTFTIFIPVIRIKTPLTTEQMPKDIPVGKGMILLVDDEEVIVDVGKALLDNLGYKVQGFTQPLLALNAFRQVPNDFDAVITDYTMPQMTGYELAKKLREIRSDIPIILCSGYIDQAMEEKAQEANVNEFIRKPITRQDIAFTLRRILAKSNAIQ